MNGNTSSRLLSFVERIERLNEEVREIREQIKDVKAEAKSAGFDPKVIAQMIRERAMGEAERQEWQALCETYRAALGMLDGTPLGDATRKRLLPPPRPGSTEEQAASASEPAHPATLPPASPETIEAARAEGRVAHLNGPKVTDNPYPAGDARRAAWDTGWCECAGSDGMEIPPAWRRTKPAKKKPEGDSGDPKKAA